MKILLQNREQFAQGVLPRIPAFEFRVRLETLLVKATPTVGIVTLDKSDNNISRLVLLDPFCKPTIGVKWARTALSIEEVIARAMRFEELVVLGCAFQQAVGQKEGFSELQQEAAERLAGLIGLADELRYHRLRLVEVP